MKIQFFLFGLIALLSIPAQSHAGLRCLNFGPQAPRDISSVLGLNPQSFPIAPASASLNLCNIHTHTNAEHKGPGFSVSAGDGVHGGFKCNGTDALTESELADPTNGESGFHGVKTGDTIEVHWVFSTCQVTPGVSLDACSSASCANPTLRVETQVFLVVNDDNAPDFRDFAYDGHMVGNLHQPKSLPVGSGTPIEYLGSTTGSGYDRLTCSPLQVTWSVRPECSKVSFASLNAWGEDGNVFEEDHSHEVRQLVTQPELLSPIN